mmetsp:Transcript_2607/g.6669  ORF Transcript_2607/g.6669 Transcript_2607/m.6669 type:complete len:297 (-) Transcript_2607:404-1294(-)
MRVSPGTVPGNTGGRTETGGTCGKAMSGPGRRDALWNGRRGGGATVADGGGMLFPRGMTGRKAIRLGGGTIIGCLGCFGNALPILSGVDSMDSLAALWQALFDSISPAGDFFSVSASLLRAGSELNSLCPCAEFSIASSSFLLLCSQLLLHLSCTYLPFHVVSVSMSCHQESQAPSLFFHPQSRQLLHSSDHWRLASLQLSRAGLLILTLSLSTFSLVSSCFAHTLSLLCPTSESCSSRLSGTTESALPAASFSALSALLFTSASPCMLFSSETSRRLRLCEQSLRRLELLRRLGE